MAWYKLLSTEVLPYVHENRICIYFQLCMMVNSQSSPRWLVCEQNIDTRKPESWNCVHYTFSPYFPVIGTFEHTEHHLLFLEASCENKPPELSHIPVISFFNTNYWANAEFIFTSRYSLWRANCIFLEILILIFPNCQLLKIEIIWNSHL